MPSASVDTPRGENKTPRHGSEGETEVLDQNSHLALIGLKG